MAARATPRQIGLLAVLLAVFAAVVYYNLRATGAPPAAGQNPAGQSGPSRAAAARDQAESAPPVRLAQLKIDRPAAVEGGRNLFREKPKPPPPAPKVAPPPPPDPNAPPPPPPPPPPITLKLIGIVQGSGKPIAALERREGRVLRARRRHHRRPIQDHQGERREHRHRLRRRAGTAPPGVERVAGGFLAPGGPAGAPRPGWIGGLV